MRAAPLLARALAPRTPLALARGLSSTAAFPAPVYIRGGSGNAVRSPWHDIPLRSACGDPAVFNFVCEIPRGGRAKMEIATGQAHNPIVQDATKAGAPRFYGLDSLVNYGALPQTYEDPAHTDAWTKLAGDGDPIDVCDISSTPRPTGSTYRVKVLGALAMIDGGETDWKVLAVRTDDPAAAGLTCVSRPTDALARAMDEVRTWFRVYKTYEGKGENDFAFEGRWLDRDTTLAVIESTHAQWKAVLARAEAPKKKGPWLPQAGWKALAPSDIVPADLALSPSTSSA